LLCYFEAFTSSTRAISFLRRSLTILLEFHALGLSFGGKVIQDVGLQIDRQADRGIGFIKFAALAVGKVILITHGVALHAILTPV
jgi:hypothetical protein